MSTQLSSRTWPIRSVQVQLGSVAHPRSEPPLRAASGSQEDPEHRRANLYPPRTTPLTMETLAAHGEDSLQRLRRRVEASIARSACPASSSTVLGVGPEEQEDLRRRMDEVMLHQEYHKSTVGEDGEIPLDALGSPPQKLRCVPSFNRCHLQTWRTQYHYRDDQEYTSTREHGIHTCQ